MTRKPSPGGRTQKADDPIKTRIVSIGRWYRKLQGRTDRELDEKAAAFQRELDERRERWRTDYGVELPTNVDQWERLLSRAGLTPQETSDVLGDIPDIDLIINHVEGYLDRMRADAGRTEPTPMRAHEPDASLADQAFGAARKFVEHLAMVAQRGREYRPHPDKPDAWQDVAFNFAEAFIAWYDLTHLLTPAVCTEARRVYPPGAASIKLGASNEAAPVVPAMPASVVNGLAAYRRVTLGATPYPTVIEAVADELGVYFRNAVYTGRRHPLEPDLDRLIGEAKARATARQVAQGKPAEPMGWGADLDELRAKETRAVVRERLGIRTYGDGQDLMMREWNGQDRARGESALYLLRCDPINFPDLRMQLIREAEAVIAAASKPNAPTIDPELLARLEAGIAAVHSIGSNVDAGMTRVEQAVTSIGMAALNARRGEATQKLPKTRRGLQRLAETTTRDQLIISAINEGKSYRQVARECKVGKTTVERVAKAWGLTGHAPETVPLEGTLQENLSVRGKPGKRGSR